MADEVDGLLGDDRLAVYLRGQASSPRVTPAQGIHLGQTLAQARAEERQAEMADALASMRRELESLLLTPTLEGRL